MALVKAKQVADKRPINYDNPIAAKIQQRRYQMLVHSYLYYELDASIVSDEQWMKWAQELVSLQNSYPDIASRVIFAEAFEGFDGSSGYDLPYCDERIMNIAHRLIKRDKVVKAEPKLASHTPVAKPTVTKKEVKLIDKKPRKGLFSIARE